MGVGSNASHHEQPKQYLVIVNNNNKFCFEFRCPETYDRQSFSSSDELTAEYSQWYVAAHLPSLEGG